MNIFHPALGFVPSRLRAGSWLQGDTLPSLIERVKSESPVLPICRWGVDPAVVAGCGSLVLPPLYADAMDDDLRAALLDRVARCFPWHEGSRRRGTEPHPLRVDELEAAPTIIESMHATRSAHDGAAAGASGAKPPLLVAFSVDTAVEQHGPHLPLATDTIQSYAVLKRLADETAGIVLAPPVDYGQLTWGLPFGMSIDITAPLLTRYVAGYANVVWERLRPDALYVVDVHGSIVHRTAIQAGLAASRAERWLFRWLHEPLVEFAGQRGDQHAGGVETALIEHISPELIDRRWFPARFDDLVAGQTSVARASELSADLGGFIAAAESNPWNGIVGDLRNYRRVDADDLMARMLATARADIAQLNSAIQESHPLPGGA